MLTKHSATEGSRWWRGLASAHHVFVINYKEHLVLLAGVGCLLPGPHCNGANKAAIRLSQLGRQVNEMIGGATGWVDEDFTLVEG